MAPQPVDRVVDHDDGPARDAPPGPLAQVTTVLTVRGDVDGPSADALRHTVQPLLTAGHRLVLDMSDVTFLGSSGIRFLLDVHHACLQRGLPWAVVAGDTVGRLLRAVGADSMIAAVASLAEALCAAQVVDGGPHCLLPVVDRNKARC